MSFLRRCGAGRLIKPVFTHPTADFISDRLRQAYQPGLIASNDGLTGPLSPTCAAVLVPLVLRRKAWHLVFTRRTESVAHHKGQVSFPGGACDPQDASPEATALREATEEIGLAAEDVRLLGRLNDVLTITNYRVTPVVGVMPWPYPLRLAPQEVARVFTIPLRWLAAASHRVEEPFTPQGAPRAIPVICYQEYDHEVLWGITARLVCHLFDTLA